MRTLALLLLIANTALAQKAPELGYVFPPAVQAGARTDVQLGGYDFTPDMQFFVHHDRVTMVVLGPPGDFIVPAPPYWFGEKGRATAFPIPREIPARLEVPSDCRPGLVRWQVANANGSAATAVFYVSDGPEVVEDRYRDQPQSLAQLPIGVSGRLEKIAEVDQYSLTAQRDGPISVELFARRLGANLNGIIEVRDAAGRVVADAADTEGLDTAVTFAARANASYLVRLHDVDFRGNRAFVYRLAITPGPRVITTIPAAARRGGTGEVEFIGYGVASGAARLESTKRTLAFPAEAGQAVMRYALETPHGMAPPIEIPLSDLAETRAQPAPQIRGDNPTELAVPCAVTAVLGAAGEEVFTWHAGQGDVWNIAVRSRSIGADLDPALSIRDAGGKQLAYNDDLPGTPDAGLEFKAPADGRYTCVVSDLSGRGGRLSSVYRLSFQRRPPTFSLSAPQQVHLPIAGEVQLQVKATRMGGHDGDIALRVRGLPAGVTAPEDLKIPAGKSEVKFALRAADDAASTATMISIVGESAGAGENVVRLATAVASGNLCPQDPAANQTEQVLLATTLTPRFSVELIDKNRQRAVHRGTTYPAPFIIRREEGFDAAVMLQMAARQGRHRQGIRAPVMTVPAGTDRAWYPCFLPEWLETDRTTRMVVLGVAQQADPQGNVRYVTQPADARVTMILEGALLKIAHRAGELTVAAGDGFRIPVDVSRSAKLQTPVSLELIVPDELTGLVACDPAGRQLSANQQESVLQVRTVRDARLTGRWDLQIKATTLLDEQWPVISQAEVTVEFQ